MGNYRTFSEMAKTLRVHARAGFDTRITLHPKDALHMAEILDAHERRVMNEARARWYDAIAYAFVMLVPVPSRLARFTQSWLLPYAGRWAYRHETQKSPDAGPTAKG